MSRTIGRHFKEQAIEEFTEIVKTIVIIRHNQAGCTGFLDSLEDRVKEELLKYIESHA